jgi:hypothetical protein
MINALDIQRPMVKGIYFRWFCQRKSSENREDFGFVLKKAKDIESRGQFHMVTWKSLGPFKLLWPQRQAWIDQELQ